MMDKVRQIVPLRNEFLISASVCGFMWCTVSTIIFLEVLKKYENDLTEFQEDYITNKYVEFIVEGFTSFK